MQKSINGSMQDRRRWYPVWRCHVQDYAPIGASASDLTQQMTFQNNLDGESIRIRLSNLYGKEPLPISNLQVMVSEEPVNSFTNEKADIVRTMTIHSSPGMILPPGEECMTDPVLLPVKAGELVTVKMTFPGECHISGCCGFHSDNIGNVMFFEKKGRVKAAKISRAAARNFSPHVVFGIRSIEVASREKPVILAAFGDSIVQQGYWAGALQRRFAESMPGWLLYNEGISGNRILYDNHSSSNLNPIFGKAGIRRFETDVFSSCHPDIVLIAEGVNDLVHPGNGSPISETVTAEELIGGLKKLCCMTEKNGSIPLPATISPFLGYNEIEDGQREEVRQQVNHWIRQMPYFLDVDACVRSRFDASCLDAAYDIGDHLHLNALAGDVISEEAVPVLKKIIEKETAA